MLSNAEIKHLSELKERQGRQGQGLFLIEGMRSVTEALNGHTNIRQLIVNLGSNSSKFSHIYSLAEDKGVVIEETPATKFNRLSSTETSQGIIAVASIPAFTFEDLVSHVRSKRKASLVVLDHISDPGNLGTILRSAAWFGVDGVLISRGSVDAYNPKVVRSAMAAICQLDVVQDVSLPDKISELKSIGFAVIASTQDAALSYADYDYPKRAAIVFGSEATGIVTNVLGLCDTKIAIPRIGKMESLNVGVASSIILSEITRQRSHESRGR